EPDVGDRRGELDVAHALAAHLGERHLDAALLAGDAAEFHALVLAAQALVILDRSENAGAEQPVALRLEGAVVDGLRLLDLAVAPGADALGAGDRDADLVEGRSALGLAQYVDQIGHLWGPTVSLDLIREGKRGEAGPGHWADGSATHVADWLSSTLRPSERSSLTRTLKDSGMPASKVSSPRTIAS